MSSLDRTSGLFHSLESETPEARRVRKWEAVKSLLAAAADTSGEFRARMSDHGFSPGDIKDFDDFARIPVLRKKDIIRLQQEHGLDWMLSSSMGRLRRIYQSPGPIFDPEGETPDYWGWAEGFFACGFRPDDLVQVTFGYHLTPAGLMMEEPLRHIGCCCIPAGPGNTQVQIELMTRLPVTGFVGMASYLKVIGEKTRAGGFDPRKDLNLQVAFVAAERLTDALRNDVESLFDMQVRQGYGTADVGCIAYECPELGGMHLSSRCWVEICDPETGLPLPEGETGEVVVTPFTRSYPLVRLATGDLSALETAPCGCGRTAVKLKGILGRVDDTAKVKGQFIYPSQAAPVLANIPGIERWQIVVSNPGGRDTLTLRIQASGPVDEGSVAAAFQQALKLRPAVEVLDQGTELDENAPHLKDERIFD